MISVISEAQMRSCQPMSRSRPRISSVKGNVCATKSTAAGESILYDSTCCPNVERFVETENFSMNIGHKCVLGKKILEMPAYTKIPPRTSRQIQRIALRGLDGLDCIMDFERLHEKKKPNSFLGQKLIKKRLKSVVSHDSGIRKGLAFAMKDRRRRLLDPVGLAKGVILVNHGI